MAFYPENHRRRSIRFKGYDYAREGLYFISICCADHDYWFGRISSRNGKTAEMVLNQYGRIAYNALLKLPQRFPSLTLDVFQIMPNHLHMILKTRSPDPEIKKEDQAMKCVLAGFTPAPLLAIKNPAINTASVSYSKFEKGSSFESGAGATSGRDVGIGDRARVNPS